MPALPPTSRLSRGRSGQRGSLLIVAMLLATAIALVLGSYLALARTSLKVAHRTFFAQDASNLADAGLEEAIYAFNLMASGTAPATAWSAWTLSGTTATRTLAPFNRDQNAVGIVKICVQGYDGSVAAPVVYTQAVITPFDGNAPVVKTVQLKIKKNVAPNGVVALNGLALNGISTVDSFNSNPTNSATGPWLAYVSTIATANASVVALAGSLTFSSVTVAGNLYLGSGVTPPASGTYTGTLTTNYSASFLLPAYPTAASVSQSYNVGSTIPAILPVIGHLPASDGRYYYFCSNATIGTTAIAAGKNVTIVGTGTSMGPGLTIPSGSSCYVYMDGALTLPSGSSFNNSAWAGALQIFSSTTGTCTCAIGNKGQMLACLYAPKASLVASGGGSGGMLVGRYVANTITVSGKLDFHFDQALQPSGSGTLYNVTQWLEFQSAADRATVSGLTGNYLR
ncbi:hypothetical protein [Opitutus sp. GAS368]|jgi:hypothetical protein|uniref:DUF7305 domain-containing protein n=1 Tax=Opitutus sp. GAS368 TaxID=1882749 RepID=UPI00087B2620|nr:hypothetical protein [Opitutus sp. GAS368]SDS38816.1 hypothetical protein SAMN05444173_2748 [Opitutus sp. GAS368]